MPPVVADLCETDKDWQACMLPANYWLAGNVKGKWVNYKTCFSFASLTFFFLEYKHQLTGSVCFLKAFSVP